MRPVFVLAGVAVVLVCGGAGAKYWSMQASAPRDQIDSLPVLHAPDFRKTQVGTRVLVEGTLSERNPGVLQGSAPQLWLKISEGDAHLVNDDWRFDPPGARALTPADPLLVFGKVRPSEAVGELEAVWVFVGTREQWLAKSAAELKMVWAMPWVLWGAALALGVLAFVKRKA